MRATYVVILIITLALGGLVFVGALAALEFVNNTIWRYAQ